MEEGFEIHKGDNCPICGDSGPCDQCERGLALAQEQSKDKKEETQQSFEKTDCQYCSDSGICSFCERGRLYAEELKKRNK
ncbi:MAG: hypothetical protein WC884_03995 [Candidatus Paceibacterota bacterium]